MTTHIDLPISDRIIRLREELFSTPDRICFARAEIATGSYRETEGEPWVLRRARALRAIFREMPLFIRPGELLVGQRAAVLGGCSLYPEYHLHDALGGPAHGEIYEYWQGRTLGDESRALFPEPLIAAEKELAAAYCTGTSTGFGHVIVDYEKVLRRGFDSIVDETRNLLDATPAEDVEGRQFLEAVLVSAEGIILWARRYAELADRMAAKESDPRRRAELQTIAATCRRVPAAPARNFREALQSFWFTHLAMHLEQYGWSISAGRFDQYIYPYFRDAMESDTAGEAARELLLNLWVKFMENVGTRIRATTFQNLTLGGRDTEGNDQSNELSHLCLEATVALRFNQPALSVRWHPGIDPDFWAHVHRTIARGLGMPALFNDEVVIQALTGHGVAPADAIGYGIVGCVEAAVPGKQQGVTAGGHINVAKALELALDEGRSTVTGERIGLPTGAPESFTGFEDLWEAYVAQVEYLAGLNILAAQIAGTVQKRRGHCPLMSSLLDDCLTRRRDLVHGGSRYNLPGISIFGNTNVYDGLLAVRRCVCEEKQLTWTQLRRALRDDFEGCEEIRQLLANRAPRFGNDISEVDELANRVNAVHAEFCWKHLDSRGGRFTCGVWPVEGHVHSGYRTGATPDGRRRGTPLADGVGACHGADRSGPTALLRSVAQLDHVAHWPAGNTCNIKFSSSTISTVDGSERLRDLTTTYMQLGGQQLQINVIDRETLRDAQVHPEDHRDLIVRVAGFSAYFTQLKEDVQEEIIMRTEQNL